MIRVQKRRRREGRTDYKRRKELLKSGRPRLDFRKSNRYVLTQYLTSKEAKDSIRTGLTSKALLKYGWPKEFNGSLKSLPASYLLGFLIGKKIIKEKLESPIIDLGMMRTLHKTKPFAFIKGVKDSGLDIQAKEESFPSEERIQGKNLKKDFSSNFESIKLKIESTLNGTAE